MQTLPVTFPHDPQTIDILQHWSWSWSHDDSLMFDCSSLDDYEGLAEMLNAVNPALLNTIRGFSRSGITFILINWV